MTEYWKSLPRKFCTYCKCWITDNKSSVEFHERGKNHLENVKKKIDELRKKGLKDAKEKESVDSFLKAMEEAALKSAREDLKRDPSLAALYGASTVAKASEAAVAAPTTLHAPAKSRAAAPAAGPRREAGGAKGGAGQYGGSGGGGERHRPAALAAGGRGDAGAACGTSDLAGAATGGDDDAGGDGDEAQSDEWQRALSPEGYEYYWNVRTGESSWTLPEGAAVALPAAAEEAAEAIDGSTAAPEQAETEKQKEQQQEQPPSGRACLGDEASDAAGSVSAGEERIAVAATAAASAASVPPVTVAGLAAADVVADGTITEVKDVPLKSDASAAACIKLETLAGDTVKTEPTAAASRAKAAIAAATARLKAEAASTGVKSEADLASAVRVKAEPGARDCSVVPANEPPCETVAAAAAAGAVAAAALKVGSALAAEQIGAGAGSGHKRPAISFSPYGRWVTVEAEKPPPVLDLQLPTNASNFSVPVLDIPLPERVEPLPPAKDAQPQFKEKVVTLQGKVTGEVAFKRRKVGGAKQNARRRDDEDQ